MTILHPVSSRSTLTDRRAPLLLLELELELDPLPDDLLLERTVTELCALPFAWELELALAVPLPPGSGTQVSITLPSGR